MQESYGEGAATHTGPESCGGVRKGVGEALTGGGAGRVLSREIHDSLRGADAVEERGRPHRRRRYREAPPDPARSETPGMRPITSHGNREIPRSSVAEGVTDRIGKSKDTRR
jgi:RNA-directed DNA polymerase